MRTQRTTTLYQEERLWFSLALLLLCVVLSLYMYFVSASVVHVVMRKEVDQQITAVGSYVSELEANYIEAQHSVSAEIASRQGYTLTKDKIFIDRSQATLVLSRN